MGESARVAVRWALGLPLLAGLAAGALLASPWWLQLSLAVAAVVSGVYLLAASGTWLFGPVLLYELVRQARAPRVPLLRVGYGLLLLLALFLVYLQYTPGTGYERILAAVGEGAQVEPNQRARFAERFFYIYVALQFALLLLFAPALVGGSLATERQRGSLDLLFTTDLSSREIVLGKLGSHLVYLLLLLFTGLPILGFLQMLGGIDPGLIFFAFAGAVLNLFTLAALSAMAVVTTPRASLGLVAAYLFALLHGGVTLAVWGVFLVMMIEGNAGVGAALLVLTYVAYCSLMSWGCLHGACHALRREVGGRASSRDEPGGGRRSARGRERKVLGDRDPMLWKERHHASGAGSILPAGFAARGPLRLLLVAGVAVLFLAAVESESDTPASMFGGAEVWHNTLLHHGVPWAQLLLVMMALRACAAFTRERENRTLDGLLATPLTEREIVRAKGRACLWGVHLLLIPLGGFLLVCVCVGGVAPAGVPLTLLAFAVHTAFVINLGLYCSAGSSTTLRSSVATLVLLVAFTLGHWLAALAVSPLVDAWWGEGAGAAVQGVHLWGLTLPGNLAAFCFQDDDLTAEGFWSGRLLPGLVGLGYYGGLALLLRWGVYRRMRGFRGA